MTAVWSNAEHHELPEALCVFCGGWSRLVLLPCGVFAHETRSGCIGERGDWRGK